MNYIYWVCVCSLSYRVRNAHASLYIVMCGLPRYCHTFAHYRITSKIFGKEILLNIKCYWTQNVAEHKMSLNTKCYWTQNVAEHKMLLNTKCCWTQNVTENKMLLNTKCVLFIFSATFAWNISHSKKNLERYDKKCTPVFRLSTHHSWQILMKLEFSRKKKKKILEC
jgi:hypothetical protein